MGIIEALCLALNIRIETPDSDMDALTTVGGQTVIFDKETGNIMYGGDPSAPASSADCTDYSGIVY
jgi:hypothetical protein